MASDEPAPGGSHFSLWHLFICACMPLIKTFAELLLGAKHCSVQGKGMISVFRQQGVVFRDADAWLVTTGYQTGDQSFLQEPTGTKIKIRGVSE